MGRRYVETYSGQVILPHVRMQENMIVRIVPTNVKATEQAPWFERALRPMDIARILLLVTKINAITNMTPTNSRPIGPQRTPAMSTIVWHSGWLFLKLPARMVVSIQHLVNPSSSSRM